MSQIANHAEHRPIKFKIAGMDCGNCALTIENSIRQLPNVAAVSVSFTTESMEVVGQVSRDTIEHRLRDLGYRLAEQEELQTSIALPEHRGVRGFIRFLWEQPALQRALFVTGAVLIGLIVLPGLPTIAGVAPLDLLFAIAVLIAGGPIFIKGFRALLFARRITIDLLMAIASIGALAIGATG